MLHPAGMNGGRVHLVVWLFDQVRLPVGPVSNQVPYGTLK